MKVKFKKLSDKAIVPSKAHESDAGFDLTCVSAKIDFDGNIVYHTDLSFEIPKGHVGLLFSRSSVCRKSQILTNCVGVIDSGYRGEVTLKFKPLSGYGNNYQNDYKIGERIGQLIIIPYPEIELVECDDLSDSDRGINGYGSSGK